MTPDLEKRLLASVDQPRKPDDAFANGLLDRVLIEMFGETYSSPHPDHHQHLEEMEETTMTTTMPTLVLPYPGQPRREFPSSPRSSIWTTGLKKPLLAIAAVLCLLLGGAAIVAFRAGNDPEPVNVIPAVVSDVDDIPANSATVETLFATTVSPDQIPLDLQLDWNRSFISYMEMEPGGSYNTDHPAFFCCQGIAVLTILDGELSFADNTGPMLVYRSGGDTSPESFEPGSPVTIGTGDTAVHRMSVPVTVTNTGEATTSYLAGYVYHLPRPEPPGADTTPDRYSEAELTWTQTLTPAVEEEGPVSVSWERISFEPGQDIVIDTATSQTILATIKDGRLRLFGLQHDGTLERDLSTPLWGPQSMALDGFGGTELALASESEEPAVLYLFRFNPPDGESA